MTNVLEVRGLRASYGGKRILDGTAKKLGIDPAKVISTVALHGNTSAASVPLALVTAVRSV